MNLSTCIPAFLGFKSNGCVGVGLTDAWSFWMFFVVYLYVYLDALGMFVGVSVIVYLCLACRFMFV